MQTLRRRYVRALACSFTLLCAHPGILWKAPPALRALLEFLQVHAGDGVLDAAAMGQLGEVLVPAALAAWPRLQQVLESEANYCAVFNWTPADGFKAALARDQVLALTQLLMLQVGRCCAWRVSRRGLWATVCVLGTLPFCMFSGFIRFRSPPLLSFCSSSLPSFLPSFL